MFYYVKGELVMTDPQSAVVDCGGVGYKLTVSMNTLSHLTETGKRYACIRTFPSVKTRLSFSVFTIRMSFRLSDFLYRSPE